VTFLAKRGTDVGLKLCRMVSAGCFDESQIQHDEHVQYFATPSIIIIIIII